MDEKDKPKRKKVSYAEKISKELIKQFKKTKK